MMRGKREERIRGQQRTRRSVDIKGKILSTGLDYTRLFQDYTKKKLDQTG
jgi:hypothetical protein